MSDELKRGTIQFETLTDLRIFMELVGTRLAVVKKAVQTMHMCGFPINTSEMGTARKEARNLLVINLTLTDEFVRLHKTQCEAPKSCELNNTAHLDQHIQQIEGECVRSIIAIDEEEATANAMGMVEGPLISPDDLDAFLNQLNRDTNPN